MARSRWIAPLCAAAAITGGLLVATPLLITKTHSSPRNVSGRSSLFAREEPRLSQAPLDALTTVLGLTDDQQARVRAIQQVVQKHDQQYERKQRALIHSLYGAMLSRRPTSPPTNNLAAVGIERLKMTWRQRQMRADSEELGRMARDNYAAVLALESTAAEEINRVLTDGQRQKLPLVLQQMRELRSVGLPISFCAAVLQNPRQRQQIAAISAEAEQKRKRSDAIYNDAMRSARAMNRESGGPRANRQDRMRIFQHMYTDYGTSARTAHSRALATLTPAQRQIMRRSGAVASPF